MDSVVRRFGKLGFASLFLCGLWIGAGATVAIGLELGEKAPDFTLPSTTGDKISLSHFLGKKLVLIEFYVTDFTPT